MTVDEIEELISQSYNGMRIEYQGKAITRQELFELHMQAVKERMKSKYPHTPEESYRGKTMIFGTAGDMSSSRDLEKMFHSPEHYKVMPIREKPISLVEVISERQNEMDILTFKLQSRIIVLDEIDAIRPYDMMPQDYYQYLINEENLHCGSHAPDSPEGKWLDNYEKQRKYEDMVGKLVSESDNISITSIVDKKLLDEMLNYKPEK